MSEDPVQPDANRGPGTDLYELATAYLDGALAASDERALAELLRSDPQARRKFVGVCIQAQLLSATGVPPGTPNVGGERGQAPPSPLLGSPFNATHGLFSDYARFSILAATLTMGSLLTLLGAWVAPTFQRAVRNETFDADRTHSVFVAQLVHTSNCRWPENHLPPLIGQQLSGGTAIRFLEGIVEIRFRSGAKVMVEGPAELTLVSAGEVRLDRGRLTAEVSDEAVGFAVKTPSARVVDLGTQFSVYAEPSGDVEVHVYDGKVSVEPSPPGRNRPVVLQRGQTARIADGRMTVGDTTKSSDWDADSAREPEFARWHAFSGSLGRDTDVVAYYTFERSFPGAAHLVNHSVAGTSLDGATHKTQWSKGRWPEKDSLRFEDEAARVSINIPDQLDAVTLAAWVRLDAIGPQPQSLLHSDGHTWNRVGAVHWFVDQRGRLCIAFGNVAGEHVDVRTGEDHALVTAGTWRHLATTVDVASGEVASYIDGALICAKTVKSSEPLRIGTAQLGNASVADRRFLVGSMDELAIFRRALSSREIDGIFKIGVPKDEPSETMERHQNVQDN
ncbi:MAG: LamG-like jellyroll fold domain-containing protein [Patescibacteria group bacterium]|nr:LamG-like jellyroll fold domain-containing protein [Patescibacteria group bacterium]